MSSDNTMIKHKSAMSKIKQFFTRPEYVFVVPALFFGLLSTVFIPQLSANDENMHFIRSYELTEGEIGHKCHLPVDIKERAFYQVYAQKPNFSFDKRKINPSNKITTDCGTATGYNPVLHIPQVIGISLAKLIYPSTGVMILFGRIANLLVYCAGLFFIIKTARIGKWMLVIIGLMPTLLHMASTLSGDVMNNVIVLGFITYLFNIFTQKEQMTRRQIMMLMTFSIFLATTKPTNAILLLPILFLPARLVPQIAIKGKYIPKSLTRFGIAFGAGALIILVIALWAYIYKDQTIVASASVNPVAERPYRLARILFNTFINPDIIVRGIPFADWLLRSAVGSFSSFGYHLPFYVVTMAIVLVVVVGLTSNPAEEKLVSKTATRMSLAMISTWLIMIIAITYGLYVSWALRPDMLGSKAQYAYGLQGRYFIPFLILLYPLFVWLRKYIRIETNNKNLCGYLILAFMCSVLTFYTIQTICYNVRIS